VAEPDLSGLHLAPAMLEIVRRVVGGEEDPAEGATELTGLWLPAGKTDQGGALYAMRLLIGDWGDQGLLVPARRLAELTWLLAQSEGDEDSAVWSAAALGQLMATDPDAARRRLELLEYAVPRLVASDSPDPVKAVLWANLADARFNSGGGDQADLRATVEACEAALSLGLDERTVWPGRVHFIAGTAYQSIGDQESGNAGYVASIDHLMEAVRRYPPEVSPDERGSALNNLGNTVRKLGARRGDPALLQTAVECYDEALPFRREPVLSLRTQRGRAEALRLLSELHGAAPGTPPPDQAGSGLPAARLIESGDSAYGTSRHGDDAAAYLRLAIERYLEAARLLGRDAPAAQRSEMYHRMIRPFVDSTEDDALLTGICFAAAARRVGAPARPPVAQARSGFQQGYMLMKLGDGRNVQHLRMAEALFREVQPLLAAEGEPGEGDLVANLHEMCLTLLAVNGDQDARQQALRLHAARQLERLDGEVRQDPPDHLHAVYREYLSLVRREAEAALATLLAETELSHVQAVMDPGLSNTATSLAVAEAAGTRLEVGDLAGTLELIATAEKFAADAQASGVPAWCQLARFYAGIPLRDQAEQSVRQARAAADRAVTDPASEEDLGWWLPPGFVDHYREEIDAAAALVAQDDAGPRFRPEVTAAALMPRTADGRLRRVLEEFVRAMGRAG